MPIQYAVPVIVVGSIVGGLLINRVIRWLDDHGWL